MAYGGYELQRGDQDPKKGKTTKWANKEVTVEKKTAKASSEGKGEEKATTLAVVTNHVEQLQKDLRHLGFALVGTPDGGFGLGTEFAVREFQYYASLDKVAQWTGKDDTGAHEVKLESKKASEAEEQRVKDAAKDFPKVSAYVAGLKQVDNGEKYTGAITGKVNTATGEAIEHWKTEKYRCPVVIESWTNTGKTLNAHKKANLWGKNDETDRSRRVVAFDLSGVYSLPTTPTNYSDDTYVHLGQFSDKSATTIRGGPNVLTKYNQHWPEAKTCPEGFMNKAWSALTDPEKSTFKVVQFCAQKECSGHFDVVNCWDNAFVSLGPCHWTLALGNGKDKGELGGFLEYVDGQATTDEPPWYHAHGLQSKAGKLSAMSGQRKYTGAIAITKAVPEASENADEKPGDTASDGAKAGIEAGAIKLEEWPRTGWSSKDKRQEELNQFRTWHWAYRWIMAGRATDERFVTWRHLMWDMARMRIRDLLAAQIEITHTRFGPALKAAVGDVFTCEWAVAFLVRWHIWRPAHLVESKKAHDKLTDAVKKGIKHSEATVVWTTDADGKPEGWGADHEAALVWGLKASAQEFKEDSELTEVGSAALTAWNKTHKTSLKRSDLVYSKKLKKAVEEAEDFSGSLTVSVTGFLTTTAQNDEDDPAPAIEATIPFTLAKAAKACTNFKWPVGKVNHTLGTTRGSFQGVYPEPLEAEAVGAGAGGEAGTDLPVADTP